MRSRHDHTLVLKGGMLLAAFDLRRATRDVDVLALKTDNDPAYLLAGTPPMARSVRPRTRSGAGAQVGS